MSDVSTRKTFSLTVLARGVVTGIVIFPAILAFIGQGMLIKFFTRDPILRTRRLIKNASNYAAFALRMMRISIRAIGEVPPGENFLMVSNHMSYLDLLIIASIHPSVFVTSIDMGEIFFLGTMCEIGGSVFIERRNRERVGFDTNQMSNALKDGFNVILFPEGTSSNGSTVLPFKKSLLLSAGAADKRILPITLKYVEVDGKPFSPANRDRVCWYGSMGFLPHLIGLLGGQSATATVQFHMPIRPRAGDNKDTLAKWTYRTIASSYLAQEFPNDVDSIPDVHDTDNRRESFQPSL